MAWDTNPFVDGILLKNEHLRRGLYLASPAQGIAGVGDLKVRQLSVAGNGFRVMPGGAAVYNKYVTPIRQSYAVGMSAETIFPSGSMPASVGSPRNHLIAVTVGDPQYGNSGHPWMPAGPLPDPATFEYVRTWLFQNVPAGADQDWLDANFAFPGLALARLEVPASTTTITDAMIKDVREMANPHSKDVQWSVSATVADPLGGTAGVYEYWPDNSQVLVKIPKWASYAYIDGSVNGFQDSSSDATKAEMRIGSAAMNVYTPTTKYSAIIAGRASVNIGGRIFIPEAYRGTSQNFQISATPQDAASVNDLTTDAWTNCQVHIRFTEEPD